MFYSYKLTSFGDYVSAFNLINGKYSLELGIPGFKKDDIKISLEDSIYLVIEGSNTKYGDFERSYSIPEDGDEEKIEAKVENGILTISFPQKVKKKSKIEIR